MNYGIIDFLSGRVKLGTDAENREKFICFLMENGIDTKIKAEENGKITVILPCRTAKKIASALDKCGIIVYIINIYGIKKIVSSYGRRYGLIAGTFLFFLLLWISTLFVWKVDVSGTELLSKEQIRNELSEMGVHPGSKLSDIDKSSVSDRFLSNHPEISWAALSFRGTTAFLTLKETVLPEDTDKSETKILVSSEDATVKEILVYDGKPAVSPGTAVRKGDVLVTGYISGSGLQYSENPALRVTNARGSVIAEVEKTATETVLFTEKVTKKTDLKATGHIISVFGHEIKFGKTNVGEEIGKEKYLTVFGEIELPITVRTYYTFTEETEEIIRTSKEARAEAEKQIHLRMAENAGEHDLTFVNVDFTESEEGFTATAIYRYEKNIAVPYGKQE